jgi:hypothetical protein
MMTHRKIPQISIQAAGSKRQMSLDQLGVACVLIFHSHENGDSARRVNETVRDRYPLASDVLIASVADLKIVPRLMRRMVEKFLSNAYHEYSDQLPDGMLAEDYIIILPDWKGSLSNAVGVQDTGKTAAIAVLSPEGEIAGVYQGENLGQEALSLLDQVLNT